MMMLPRTNVTRVDGRMGQKIGRLIRRRVVTRKVSLSAQPCVTSPNRRAVLGPCTRHSDAPVEHLSGDSMLCFNVKLFNVN